MLDLSEEEIRALPPGYRINMLVHVHVVGNPTAAPLGISGRGRSVPHYSTDSREALQMMEDAVPRLAWSAGDVADPRASTLHAVTVNGRTATGETMELALCRAALLAVRDAQQ